MNTKKIFFSIFGCWLMPEKLAFAQKWLCPSHGGLQPPLAHMPMSIIFVTVFIL